MPKELNTPGETREDKVLLEVTAHLKAVVETIPSEGVSPTTWIGLTYVAVEKATNVGHVMTGRVMKLISTTLWYHATPQGHRLKGLDKFLVSLGSLLGLTVVQRTEVARRKKRHMSLKDSGGNDYWMVLMDTGPNAYNMAGLEMRSGEERRDEMS